MESFKDPVTFIVKRKNSLGLVEDDPYIFKWMLQSKIKPRWFTVNMATICENTVCVYFQYHDIVHSLDLWVPMWLQ